MENEVKKLKESNQHLNKTMSNGEKNLNAKMKNLEYNVEQLTVMYNQLMKNRSELKAHAYNQEKKIKRKEELIKKFQTALQEEKHYSYQYRSKYETLKTMVCQNDFGFQNSLLQSSPHNQNYTIQKQVTLIFYYRILILTSTRFKLSCSVIKKSQTTTPPSLTIVKFSMLIRIIKVELSRI